MGPKRLWNQGGGLPCVSLLTYFSLRFFPFSLLSLRYHSCVSELVTMIKRYDSVLANLSPVEMKLLQRPLRQLDDAVLVVQHQQLLVLIHILTV